VSPELEAIVLRCLAKTPDARFASMDEVLAALKRLDSAIDAPGSVSGGHSLLPTSLTGPQSSPHGLASGVPPLPLPGPARHNSVPVPVTVEGERGSRRGLLLAIAAGLGLVCAAGYFAVRNTQLAGSVPAAAPPAAVALPPPPAAAEPLRPSAPTMASLRITTDPDGASVKEDGVELCTSTPCDILYKGPDADPARDHKLTLGRPGYRSEMRTLKVADGSLSVKLVKEFVRAAPPPQSGARPEAPPVPTGYKTEIPY
jgi:eukaryotic-like serine/threonine-protein kinase